MPKDRNKIFYKILLPLFILFYLSAWPSKTQSGFKPILLFDDIFDKLDESRVAKIIEMVNSDTFGQLFISDTHPERTETIVKSTHQTYKIFNL